MERDNVLGMVKNAMGSVTPENGAVVWALLAVAAELGKINLTLRESGMLDGPSLSPSGWAR